MAGMNSATASERDGTERKRPFFLTATVDIIPSYGDARLEERQRTGHKIIPGS